MTGHISFEIKMLKDFDEGRFAKILGFRLPSGVNDIKRLPLITAVNAHSLNVHHLRGTLYRYYMSITG